MSSDRLFADRYRFEGRRLGVGGMSMVELAFDTRLERLVAVKLLAEHLAEDSGFVARFRREALSAARLVHPNVVQVYDFGLDDASARQYIVMEYVDGQSCAELLRDYGPMEPAEAVEILGQACRGLEYAHRNGVVHRDVKPGNLLVSREHVVKLADFGIAKAAEQSDITKVGSVIGTAAYLAPEQSRGEPAGPASDIYALGVVAYQLLTGRLPYQGSSLPELSRMQESGPPERPEQVNSDVPPELGRAVLRALSPHPRTRYADATEMERALRAGLKGVAPRESTAATVALGGEETTRLLGEREPTATRALPPTGTQRRRALEPLPKYAAPRRAPERHAPPAQPRRRRRAGLAWLVTLVVALAVGVGGFVAYQAVSDATKKTVQLKKDVQGDLEQAIDDLRDLVRDNTQ